MPDDEWENDLPDIKTTEKGVDYISDGKVVWIIGKPKPKKRQAKLILVKPKEKE